MLEFFLNINTLNKFFQAKSIYSPRNRTYGIYSFAVADVSNRDHLASFGGSGSCTISFRLDAASGRSKTLSLRLGETATINAKPCIIKRYALSYSSGHLLMCRTPIIFYKGFNASLSSLEPRKGICNPPKKDSEPPIRI